MLDFVHWLSVCVSSKREIEIEREREERVVDLWVPS